MLGARPTWLDSEQGRLAMTGDLECQSMGVATGRPCGSFEFRCAMAGRGFVGCR